MNFIKQLFCNHNWILESYDYTKGSCYKKDGTWNKYPKVMYCTKCKKYKTEKCKDA